ncbi:FliH/SctL family protein [Heliorestis acidaminivorans]|uniref:FliH/SctL family protein n=1 Tax=Heliorestis acidaminivorans TaxID=553427 RepID=UPI001478E271|nr:FliH/SctL family protein [Heliorestis acidaminivorans]
MSRVIKSSTLLANQPKLLKLSFIEMKPEELAPPSEEREEKVEEQETAILAQEEAEQILREAHQTVQELLQKAKEQTQIIMTQAKEEARGILQQAQNEAEGLKSLKAEEGYAEGYQDGYQAAIEAARNESDAMIAEAQQEVEAARQARLIYMQDQEKDMVELAYGIAEKILQYEIERNDEVILRITEKALNKARDISQVIIKVNPEDYAVLQSYKSDLMSLIKGLRSINIEKDESISRGGSIIDTAYGYVDARIDAQLEELRRVLSEIMNR